MLYSIREIVKQTTLKQADHKTFDRLQKFKQNIIQEFNVIKPLIHSDWKIDERFQNLKKELINTKGKIFGDNINKALYDFEQAIRAYRDSYEELEKITKPIMEKIKNTEKVYVSPTAPVNTPAATSSPTNPAAPVVPANAPANAPVATPAAGPPVAPAKQTEPAVGPTRPAVQEQQWDTEGHIKNLANVSHFIINILNQKLDENLCKQIRKNIFKIAVSNGEIQKKKDSDIDSRGEISEGIKKLKKLTQTDKSIMKNKKK